MAEDPSNTGSTLIPCLRYRDVPHAVDARATIVIDIVDEEHCGRGFTCRDLEQHIWSIGTYNPWQQ